MLNSVQIIGNLVKDPEFSTVGTDKSFCKMRIAVDRRKDETANFFNVVTWAQNAEFARDYLTKGRRVLVEGRLQERTWTTTDGANRSVVEIVAERVSPLDKPVKADETPEVCED